MTESKHNIDPSELKKFAKLAAQWWEEAGDLKTLHQVNPVRLCYIKSKVALAKLSVLDIGCGGGILSESLAKEGATVTGIDMNPSLIAVAKLHQLETKTEVNYLTITAEEMAQNGTATYDVITCLEMLEHVPDPCSIIKACKKLLKPNGYLFFSTLNRNAKSYLLAILGAEYVLNLLPKGTHDYRKLIIPSELHQWCLDAELLPQEIKGIHYNPFAKRFSLSGDTAVNYLFYARNGQADE